MAKKKFRCINTDLPILAFPEHELADVMAVRQVAAGTASPEQQVRCMEWILKKGCKVGAMSYIPGEVGRRDTDFNLGRQFLGFIIIDFISESMKSIKARFPVPLAHERGENG